MSFGKRSLAPTTAAAGCWTGVVHECREPARGRNGVVIEEDHKLAGRRRDPGVAGCGETARGLVVNDENAIAVRCKKRWGPVGRAVVDDDKLPSDLVIRLGEERIEALPRNRRLVVHRDDNRGGRAGSERPRMSGCAGSAVVIVKENVRSAVSRPLRHRQTVAILVGHQRRAVGDGLELIGQLRNTEGPIDVIGHR